MESNLQDPPAVSPDSSAESSPNYADVARSEKNILQWMTYLPEDCINTMIQMGWDVTT